MNCTNILQVSLAAGLRTLAINKRYIFIEPEKKIFRPRGGLYLLILYLLLPIFCR